MQWINCCWERRKNNKEVGGNKENKKKDNKKASPKYESEHANTVKNEPKLNVDEQQVAIKHIKNTVI